MSSNLPWIVSVDDHVIEPPDLWTRFMPAATRDQGPRVERLRGRLASIHNGRVIEDRDGDWLDCWVYEDLRQVTTLGLASSGIDIEAMGTGGETRPVTYEEMRPGCYRQTERLVDMDANHTEASLCFPTVSRFCGQTFLEREDKDLALDAVRAYNDWMIDDWCGGDGRGRLIPLTLIPLWDAELAATEVRRCAAKGSRAIAFSESPSAIGLPTLYTDSWEPLWAACHETGTVVNVHIGSSSTFRTTGPDSPKAAILALAYDGSVTALTDWLLSGVLERWDIRVALSEGQVGWMPFLLQRLDAVWRDRREWGGIAHRVHRPPSELMAGRVFGCIFNDLEGLARREVIGMSQIMFETDYPHSDSTWPRSMEVAAGLADAAGLDADECVRLLRGNAIDCYDLGRYGLTA